MMLIRTRVKKLQRVEKKKEEGKNTKNTQGYTVCFHSKQAKSATSSSNTQCFLESRR